MNSAAFSVLLLVLLAAGAQAHTHRRLAQVPIADIEPQRVPGPASLDPAGAGLSPYGVYRCGFWMGDDLRDKLSLCQNCLCTVLSNLNIPRETALLH